MGTILASGKRAKDGYVAMAEQDSNADGKLDANDANWKQMQVWVDTDHDGKTDGGELKSLDELGIASLDLNAVKGSGMDNGNLVGLISSYTTTDGSSHQMADVWFAKDVQPQTAEAAATVSLIDVLAAPSDALLGATPVDIASRAAQLPTAPDAQLAAIDRKLADEDELRRNNGGQWL
jgi:hypothetical protein